MIKSGFVQLGINFHNIKKIILILVCFFSFNACQMHYNGNEKVRFLIETTDINMLPIEGIEVSVKNNYGRFSQTISKGVTKADGKLELVFPSLEKDTFDYDIEFKDPERNFASSTILNISYLDLIDRQLIIPQKILPRNNEISTLEIVLNQINENRIIKSANLEGQTFETFIDYQLLMNDIDASFPIYKVFKNQSVSLNYSTINNSTEPPTIEEYSVQIPIGSESIIYYTIDL